MKKEIVIVKSYNDGEIYAREGYCAGNPAVRAIYGYNYGTGAGTYNCLRTWAIAERGTLDEKGEFVCDCYTKDNAPNKQVVGWPRVCEGWSPDPDREMSEKDWDEYYKWVDEFCEDVL